MYPMLYETLTLFAGALIAVMVTANGLLTDGVGLWPGLVIIHICGLCAISLTLLIRHKRFTLRAPGMPWYLYTGGVVGVATTLLNNVCYAPLGAALMLALCVVGQLLCSSVIDHWGLFGMRRYPFLRIKLAGFGLMALGLVAMTLGDAGAAPMDPGALPYVGLALLTGLSLSLNATFNAGLGTRIGVFPSTLVNYITGLVTSLVCILLAGGLALPGLGGLSPWLFSGGVLGVAVVAVTSAAIPRVPVVYVTILLFGGQVLMGMALDASAGKPLTPLKALGCALIFAGLVWNMLADRRRAKR
ncbi:MAG: DMT family transporter [Oscillospiraceae bacterium]|jgi:transporter family-2 protein|nr:DMT family transporter [Oscillospiraceae bacterium]